MVKSGMLLLLLGMFSAARCVLTMWMCVCVCVVGTDIGSNKLEDAGSKAEAIRLFTAKYVQYSLSKHRHRTATLARNSETRVCS